MAGKVSTYFKRFAKALLLLILALAIIIMVRTFSFSSQQPAVEAVEQIALDSGVVQRLAQSLTFPTISYTNHVDTAAFEGLDSFMRSNYPLVHSQLKSIPTGSLSHLYYWQGKRTDLLPVLLMGHADVVPVEESTRDQWQAPPFGGSIQEGFVWGRGTLDDKVAVFGLLEAMEHLLKAGHVPERSLYVAFGHDEETGGTGAKGMAAWLEAQNIQFEYILDEGQMIVENALAGLDKPMAMIGLTEKGYTTLTLSVQLSKGGHSSMPPAETAISILSRGIVRLSENPLPARIDGATEQFFEFIGPEMNMPFRAIFANMWLSKPLIISQLGADPAAGALIRTTTAPTMLRGGISENVLPAAASAKINFRILPGETIESVMADVRKIVADERIIVMEGDGGFSQNPSEVSPTQSAGFRVIQKTIRQIFPDVVVAPALVIAATDARHYSKVSKCIYRFAPIRLARSDLGQLHGVNERIGEEDYRQAVRFYRQLILNSDQL